MKNKQYMITLMIILVNFIFGCSKAQEDEKINPDFHIVKLNYTLDSKGQKTFDLNGDGKDDLGLYFEKDTFKGKTIHSAAYLFGTDIANLDGSISDFIVDPHVFAAKDTTYILRKLTIGDIIEYRKDKDWFTNYTLKKNNVLISLYTDNEPLGLPDSMKINQEFGTVEKGDFYIGYRFYEYKNGNFLEWHNGWILLNATQSSITIKEVLYNKKPETPIRAGQKI
jgi:hypothetical protein